MYSSVASFTLYYYCVILSHLIIEASTGSIKPSSGLIQHESARRRQSEFGCPVLQTLEEEIAECRGQNPGIKFNCSLEVSPENSIAEIRCKQFWRPMGTSSTKKVCINREWISESTNFGCELECGHANYESKIDSKAVILEKSSAPWVAGVFYTEDPRLSQQGFAFICEGTLISKRVVLTSAQCVTFNNTSVDRRPEDLKVALGNFRRSFYMNIGLYHDVEKVVVHHEYNATDLNNDIALIWLTEPIRIDAYHHPICLPEEDEELDVGSEGKVTVLHEEVQGERNLTIISPAVCRKHSFNLAQQVKPTKFCVQSSNNDFSICNNFGMGLAFPHPRTNKRWTLHGIRSGRMSSDAARTTCGSPILFTKAARFRQWIDRELRREPPIYSKIDVVSLSVPPSITKSDKRQNPSAASGTLRTTTIQPLSSQTQPKEREPLTPEPFLIPHYSTPKPSEVETLPKGTLQSVPQRVLSGGGGSPTVANSDKRNTKFPSDLYPVLPTRFPLSTSRTQKPRPNPGPRTTDRPTTPVPFTTVKTTVEPVLTKSSDSFYCPPLPQMQGVTQLCKQDQYEDIDDCSNGGEIGTVATLKCEKYYRSAFGPATLRKVCMKDKRWSAPRPFGCNLECGISSSPRRSFIVNGILSDRVSWPWHATIFKKVDDDFRYICGATLISKSLLLTAGHCLSKPMTADTVNVEDLRVVLAAKSSNYTRNLFDPISQANLFYVKKIAIPDVYNGVTFESDIAIIQLEFSVQLSDYVKPVCFPFQSKENSDIVQLHLSPGTKGHTVGFGIDETGNLSASMKETSLPVVSHRECGQALARFPSHSQFCAGYINGTSAVCNGDSGSGLFFSDGTGFSNRFIIQGIVSYGDHVVGSRACNHESYAVFTKVSSFAGWVQEQLDLLEPEY